MSDSWNSLQTVLELKVSYKELHLRASKDDALSVG